MNEMFSNLKEEMKETVLKDIDFNEKSKEKVRLMISKNQRSKKINYFKSKLNFALSFAVISSIIFFLGYYSADKIGLFENKSQSAEINNEVDNLNSNENENETNQSNTIITPPPLEDIFEDMTKEEVQIKMLNSMDYFDTASGKFEEHVEYNDSSTSTSIIEYKLSLREQIGGYSKLLRPGAAQTEEFYTDTKFWILNDHEYMGKTYSEGVYSPSTNKEVVSIKDVFDKVTDNVDHNRLRETPPGYSATTLFPAYRAAEFLRNDKLWEIEKQNEELMGHNTIVLQGRLDTKAIGMMKADSFRFWVDKKTGILVKYEIYFNGDITGYLYPESLEINIPIDTNDFIPNLEGYRLEIEGNNNDYQNQFDQEIEVVAHADGFTDEVTSVMGFLRKEIPFLYEFEHQDFELFSSSLERYKDYNHGYLSYSYQRSKNEEGSGKKMVFVRCYNKESKVRSTDEFQTAKGEIIEKFSLNGIDWEAFEVHDMEMVYYFGISGDYIYEVVSQDIGHTKTKELFSSFIKSN